jgi:serine protease AprX
LLSLKTLVPSIPAAALLAASLVPGLASAATPTPVTLDPNLKIHPLLQAVGSTDPGQTVRVIVQTTAAGVKAQDIAKLLPGLVIDESYSVIPAFVANVPFNAVGELAALTQVRYVSPDNDVQVTPVRAGNKTKPARPQAPKPVKPRNHGINSASLATTYPFGTHATEAWSGIQGHIETGANVTVAEIDSGVDAQHPDLAGQVLAINVNPNSSSTADGYGHGTHVAGIINGHDPDGEYLGIAPDATLISVKVADDTGAAYESDLLRGLDWVFVNAPAYHIRALNVSASVTVPESYATSPVDAAVERLWAANVTVVAAAGNLGSDSDAVWYAPGNDPLIITVGCLDDNGTTSPSDDSLCPISSRGVTEDGFAKPDLVAPGRKIVSALSNGSVLASEFADRVTADGHIRISGTSMAAPMVTGAVALMLQRQGGLDPNQIKQILTSTAASYPGQPDKAGRLDIASAVVSAAHPPANHPALPLPVSGLAPAAGSHTLLWDGARWSSTYFDGARWSSTYWDGARWSSASFDGARWSGSSLDGARWSGSTLDGARWSSAYWDGARWSAATFDGARWSSSRFDGARWSNAAFD